MALDKYYWHTSVIGAAKAPVVMMPGYDHYTGTIEEEQHGTPEMVVQQAIDNWGTDYDGENYIIIRGGDWNDYQPTYIMSPNQVDDATIDSAGQHCLNKMSGFDRWKPWVVACFTALKNAGYTVRYVHMDVENPPCSLAMDYDGPQGTSWTMHDVIRDIHNNEEAKYEAAGMPQMDLTLLDQPSWWYYGTGNHAGYQMMRNWNAWARRTFHQAIDNAVGDLARAVWDGCIVTNYKSLNYSLTKVTLRRSPWDASYPGTFEGYSAPPLYHYHADWFHSADHCIAALEAIGGDKTKIIPWVLHYKHDGVDGWQVTEAQYNNLNDRLENWGITRLLVW